MFGAALVAVALLGGAVATGEPPPVSRSHAAVETAAATTWSVTPGGSFSVIGTNVVIRFGGIELVCEGAVAEGFAPSGPGIGNPLAEFPDRPGFVFSNCQGPFGLSFDLTQVGTIELHADSYDAATDRMTGRLTNVGFDVSAPGCRVTVTGHLDIVYDNPGAELRTDRKSVV